MATDAAVRRRLLDFEIDLGRQVCDEVVETDWGTALLSPSLPQVWDASWLIVEQTGLPAGELVELGDRVLGGAGFAHRTIAICDEADGARLRPELEELPGWEVERVRYMTWRGDGGREPVATVAELGFSAAMPLRRELIRSWMPAGIDLLDETVEQLLERNRRLGEAAGERWFAAPAEEPASACCLLTADGIAQIEDVSTLEPARERGLGQSVVLAALAEARALEPELIFIAADAADWPQLIYAKLGFETAGELYILRRTP